MRRKMASALGALVLLWTVLVIVFPFLPESIAAPLIAVIPAAIPTGFFVGGQAKFFTTDLSGNASTTGSVTSGSGGGTTGALDLVGSASSNTVTLTVANNTGAGILTLPGGITANLPATNGTPVAGNCANWFSASQLGDAGSACGSGGSAGATLFSGTASTTVTQASATTLIGTVTGSLTIAANTFTVGQVLEVMAEGLYTTPAAARTLKIDLNLGGSTRITTSAVTVPASVTNGAWRLRCAITTRTTGVSGTQIANCIFEMVPSSLSSLNPSDATMPAASAWTINTTTTEVFDLQATWDATTGSPSITCSNIAAWIPGAPVSSVNGSTGAVTIPVLTAPIQGNWTAFNTASMLQVPTFANARWEFSTSAGGGENIQGVAVALPSVPYTQKFRVWPMVGTKGFSAAGIGFADGTVGTPGKLVLCGTATAGGGANALGVTVPFCNNYTNTTTFSSSVTFSNGFDGNQIMSAGQPVWFRVADNNTNWVIDLSWDGQFWVNIVTETRNTFLTATQLVVFGNTSQSNQHVKVIFDSYGL